MSATEALQVVFWIVSIIIGVALVKSIIVANRKTNEQLLMIAEITKQTHILVNKRYGEALMAQILLARSVAHLTSNPDEQEVAEKVVLDAEQAYRDHQAKQTVVDSLQPGENS